MLAVNLNLTLEDLDPDDTPEDETSEEVEDTSVLEDLYDSLIDE
jgi:hypothetical protein